MNSNDAIEFATDLMIAGKDRLAEQIIRSHARAKVNRIHESCQPRLPARALRAAESKPAYGAKRRPRRIAERTSDPAAPYGKAT